MENTHVNGYWVSKLTDENILEIVKRLTADKPTKKFVQILKIKRTEDSVEVLYESKKLKSYLTYAETTVCLNDYKVSGVNKLSVYAEAMIEILGEDYAKDFLTYAEQYIAENPDDPTSKKLTKAIQEITQNSNTEINL